MRIWWKKDEGGVEKLANLLHIEYSKRIKEIFELSQENSDGSIEIPKETVDHLNKEIISSYFDLSENDKDSYRLEAIKYLADIFNHTLKNDRKIGAIILCGDYIYYQSGKVRTVRKMPYKELNRYGILCDELRITKSFETAPIIEQDDDEWGDVVNLTENELEDIVKNYETTYHSNCKIIKSVNYKNYKAVQYNDLVCEINPISIYKQNKIGLRIAKSHKVSEQELKSMINSLISISNN